MTYPVLPVVETKVTWSLQKQLLRYIEIYKAEYLYALKSIIYVYNLFIIHYYYL